MAFRPEFPVDADRHSGRCSTVSIGIDERPNSAFDRTEARIGEVRASADRILTVLHRSERHDKLLPGLRHLAIGRATTRFDVDEGREMILVLDIMR
ncbi:MAG: hypothetical protein OXQ84_17975 [bacterium]|nr:hypothetical protein [bacterium]